MKMKRTFRDETKFQDYEKFVEHFRAESRKCYDNWLFTRDTNQLELSIDWQLETGELLEEARKEGIYLV